MRFASLLMLCALTSTALSAEFPSKTITMIVPFPPGGGTDIQARPIARALGEQLGRAVVVDNRPGAGGRIGAGFAARAVPDGHTLLFASVSTLVIEPVLRSNVGYDPRRDFEPLMVVTEMPFVLIVPASSPAKNLRDLLTQGRNRSGELTYASWGPGSAGHLVGEMLKAEAQVDLVHVPYKGEGPAVMGLLGGQVSMMFITTFAGLPHVRAGKARALAVTSPKRLSVLPDVPTFAELGLASVNLQGWYGFVVPAKTPPDAVARLHRELTAVLRSPEFTRLAESQGATVVASAPETLTQRIRSESASVASVVRAINLKLDE